MNRLIRIFSYILMILGIVILLGGLGSGLALLVARGSREVGRALPVMKMLGPGTAVMTGLRVMLQGLLVSGFGMVIYLLGEIAHPDKKELSEKSTRKSAK